jgi:hypothetical protein
LQQTSLQNRLGPGNYHFERSYRNHDHYEGANPHPKP